MTDSNPTPPEGLQGVVDNAIKKLRAAGTDFQYVEVKKAAEKLPKTAVESVCAFANASGGLMILGLSEDDFRPVDIDAGKLAADLASACSDRLEPAVRPEIDIARVDGRPVVVATVQPTDFQRRPCYVKSRGMENGAFLRTHDGDRRLNSYEVHLMVAGREQPADDAEPVEGSSPSNLDRLLASATLNRLRATRGPVFAEASDEEVLHMVGVFAEPAADSALTMAGLLALGRYPQQFFPQLSASFVVLPTSTGEPTADGTRFIDNRALDGPIPAIVSAAVEAMQRNMRRRSVVVGAGREDTWEYPVEAIREVVANALMHRDYHRTAHGSQVRIRLFPERFEVSSIGGLHGANAGVSNVEELVKRGITATRNARLAKLLEDVVIPSTGRPVCENRGSGLRAAVTALRRGRIQPMRLYDYVNELKVVIDAPDWEVSERESRSRTPELATDQDKEAMRGDRQPGPGTEHGPWARIAATPGPRYLAPREHQIAELLSHGPRSSRELSEEMGISKQSVLYWLNPMADRGLVRMTEPQPRSPRNRWELNPGALLHEQPPLV